jgi:hypothetical protein
MVPKIDIPTQDAGPWVAALDGLTRDRSLYAAVSARVRARAMEYVRNVSVEPFEAYLAQVLRSPSKHRPTSSSRGTDAGAERRSLAVSRLRKRRKGAR